MSNSMCYIHPNVFATTICDKCHHAICSADHRRYGKDFNQNFFCPICLEKSKRESKIGDIALFLVTVLAVSFLIAFAVLYHPTFKIIF